MLGVAEEGCGCGSDAVRASGIDVDRSRTCNLWHCRGAGCNYWRAASHAFDQGQAKAFKPGRKEQGIRAAVKRGELWAIHVVEVADATVNRRRFELVANRFSSPAPAANHHQLTLISPLDQEAESTQNSDYVFPRFEGRYKKQVRTRDVGRRLGLRAICKSGVHTLMNRSVRTRTDAEAIDEITSSRIRDCDQKVGVVKSPREVSSEALEGLWRHRIRHGHESEVVNSRHLCPSKGFLVSVQEEVWRKDDLIAVQES